MKLHQIRGGSTQAVIDRTYTIGIGVSLGNKWFTVENIFGLIKWSLEYTRDFVVVYIADSIHAINIEVRNKKSPEKAKEMALKLGKKLLTNVKELAEDVLSPVQIEKVYYAHWADLVTPKYQEKVNFLYNKYALDADFHKLVLDLVDDHLKSDRRLFNGDQKEKFGTYLLEELPELLNRVPIKGLIVDASIYPFDDRLFEIVEEIQRGLVFPEMREKIIDTQSKVFIEVR